MPSVSTTIFALSGSLTTMTNLDCKGAITGDFANDVILEFTVFNDAATAVSLGISTESATDANAFLLKQGENITLDLNPTALFLINASVATIAYRVLFKLRKVTD